MVCARIRDVGETGDSMWEGVVTYQLLDPLDSNIPKGIYRVLGVIVFGSDTLPEIDTPHHSIR